MTEPEGCKKSKRGPIWPRHKVEVVLESFRGEKSTPQFFQEWGIAQYCEGVKDG